MSPRNLALVLINKFFGKDDDVIAEALDIPLEEVENISEHAEHDNIKRQVFSMMTAMIVQSQVYYSPQQEDKDVSDILKNMDSEINKV